MVALACGWMAVVAVVPGIQVLEVVIGTVGVRDRRARTRGRAVRMPRAVALAVLVVGGAVAVIVAGIVTATIMEARVAGGRRWNAGSRGLVVQMLRMVALGVLAI